MTVTLETHPNVCNSITECDLVRTSNSDFALPVLSMLSMPHKDRIIRYEIREGVLEVCYNEYSPKWFEPVVESIVELLLLEPNWDSYGALPINWQLANATRELLFQIMEDDTPVPIVGPTNRGGIQIEWHERGIDLEIETISSHSFRASFEDSQTHEEWDCEINVDINLLIQCIRVLSKR